MPQTTLEKLFFMFVTVLISVHAFVLYNGAIAMGALSNRVFAGIYQAVPLEFGIAFALMALGVGRAAQHLAFRWVDPRRDRPVVVILAITCMTVLLMCPSMSLAATVIHHGFTREFLAQWLQKIAFNFPFAFFTQIFFIGPLVRWIFRRVFRRTAHSHGFLREGA